MQRAAPSAIVLSRSPDNIGWSIYCIYLNKLFIKKQVIGSAMRAQQVVILNIMTYIRYVRMDRKTAKVIVEDNMMRP